MAVKNVVILLVIVAILGGAWWLTTQYSTPVSTLVPQGDHHFAEATDLYSIDITYPAAPSAAIQARIEDIVSEEITRFKSESVGLIDDQEAARIRATGRPYELIIEYKPHAYEDFVSYEFDIYLDTGGAHPNSFFRTATFDAGGQELLLEDLFVEGAPYLNRLSEEAYAGVTAELASRTGGEVTPDMADTVRLGTTPSPEALQFFYLDDGALHLLFPPYQVAAYAAGSFDIAIPLSELQDILRPEIR